MSPVLKAALLNLAKLIQQEANPVQLPGKPARHKKTLAIKHQTLLESPVSAPLAPSKPWTAVIRDGLVVVTYRDKAAYLAESVTPKDVFGFSGKTREWRASLKWTRQNRPEILAKLGLN